MPKVVVKTGPQAGLRLELGVELVIGRHDGDLVLQDPEVSRRHAVLRSSGGSVLVEDLDSTNGTFVNRERIRDPIVVGPGDEVRVGQTTLVIEPDRRAEETIVSTPLRPDQIRSAGVRLTADAVAERVVETPTQPLPHPVLRSGTRPARSSKRWVALGLAVLIVLLGAITYVRYGQALAEDDFAARVNDACIAIQGSGNGVDLTRDPTRGALERARNARLEALSEIRALDQPERGAEPVASLLSAFGETNASILRLETAIGSGGKVAPARRSLLRDLRDERELAAEAGIPACGGLAIG